MIVSIGDTVHRERQHVVEVNDECIQCAELASPRMGKRGAVSASVF